MNGKEIFKHAVEKLTSSLLMCLEESNMNINDLDWLIPHQANQRIINAVSNKVKIPQNKIISTISNHGNTSAASIPLALDVAIKRDNIKNGDIMIFDEATSALDKKNEDLIFNSLKIFSI